MNHSAGYRLVGGALALVLGAVPGVGRAQVFLASRPHPEFSVGPLLVAASVQPDLGPVSVRVSFGLTLPPSARVEDIRQDLYLLWPAEATGGSATGEADRELRGYVEERGFAVVSEGRLGLA